MNTKTSKIYKDGFDFGYKTCQDDMAANYDAWRRARERHGMTGTAYELQDIAVRQVLYGNETGTPPHGTENKPKT